MMQFNVKDRLVLLTVMPDRGNVVTLRLMQDLKTEIGFSEEERKSIKLVLNPATGNATWNPEADFAKEIHIGEAAFGVFRTELAQLNGRNQLVPDMLPLYTTFVEHDYEEEVKEAEPEQKDE